MLTLHRNGYLLMLSYNPCEIFDYFGVEEMHGLNYNACMLHNNNSKKSSYIAGWANYIPKPNNDYKHGDARFVYINLSRCNGKIETMGTLYHEFMHHALEHYSYEVEAKEEQIISWAETESIEVYKFVKILKKYDIAI